MIVEPHEKTGHELYRLLDYGPAFVIRGRFCDVLHEEGLQELVKSAYGERGVGVFYLQAGKAYPDGCDRLINAFRRSCRDLGAYARHLGEFCDAFGLGGIFGVECRSQQHCLAAQMLRITENTVDGYLYRLVEVLLVMGLRLGFLFVGLITDRNQALVDGGLEVRNGMRDGVVLHHEIEHEAFFKLL